MGHKFCEGTELQLLLKENDGLRTEIVRLRHQLTTKQHYAGRLECLLRERMERIDQLVAQVDQLRHQNKKLDAEAEHLAEMVRWPSAPRVAAEPLTEPVEQGQ
jgi:hypothetical protein